MPKSGIEQSSKNKSCLDGDSSRYNLYIPNIKQTYSLRQPDIIVCFNKNEIDQSVAYNKCI